MRYGYLRVSRKKQTLDRQIHGLKGLCDEFVLEKVSAATVIKRPKFMALLEKLQCGDTLVIWDLDRAFRSAEDAIVQERLLRERGVKIEVINGAIDTSTAHGNRDFQSRAVAAEYERRITSERTIDGLKVAKRQGKRLGRRPKMSVQQLLVAKQKINTGEALIEEIAIRYGVWPWSLTRAIRRMEEKV